MKLFTTASRMLTVALAVALAACDDSTGPDGFATTELTTELAVTPGHIHSYETTATFTVAVTDPDGAAVTDFDVLQVERRVVGGASWSVMEATLAGAFYVVEHIFEGGSDDFDIRVTGLRPSDSDLVVLYEEDAPLEVAGAHADVGGYRIEFEPDPGHIHDGDTPRIQFWILDAATGDGITGKSPTIFIEGLSGPVEVAATEGADGLYYIDYMFTEVADTDIGIAFIGLDGTTEYEWTVPVEIHAAHG